MFDFNNIMSDAMDTASSHAGGALGDNLNIANFLGGLDQDKLQMLTGAASQLGIDISNPQELLSMIPHDKLGEVMSLVQNKDMGGLVDLLKGIFKA